MYKQDNLDEEPEKPQPPLKPGEALTLKSNIFPTSYLPHSPSDISFARRGIPSIKKTNSYDVEFDLDSLKHHQNFVFDDLLITFDDYESAIGFTIDYKLFAANIQEIVKGKLNIKVDKE